MNYEQAQKLLTEIRMLEDIVNHGVSCNRTGGPSDIWLDNKNIKDEIQRAAKEQARIELDRCKKEMIDYIGGK